MVAYRRRLRKLDGRELVNASRSGCSWPCTGNVEARYDRRDALHDVLGGTQMEAIGATRFLVGLASTALNLPLVLLFPIGLFALRLGPNPKHAQPRNTRNVCGQPGAIPICRRSARL